MQPNSLSRIVFGALIASLITARVAAAQELNAAKKRLEDSPRHHEWVKPQTEGGRTLRAFVAYPEVAAPAPVVVVIHENRGLTDWVRAVADRLAENGFLAIAPDLLSGAGPEGGGTESFASSDAARDAIYALPAEQVMADLDATIRFIRADRAAAAKVAVIGFCWGGGQAFRYAAHNDQVFAAMVFYGSAPERPLLERMHVPVYGFYGGNDFRITGQVSEITAAMKESGKKYEPVVYEGAGHAFMRLGEEPNAEPANRKAMEQAWERVLGILRR
jgi:carboxymethylenebutenolidase